MQSIADERPKIKGNHTPADHKRPGWLGIFCVLVWLYLFIMTPCVLIIIIWAIAWSSELTLYWATVPVYFFILGATTIGLWRMKKWGALLYFLYFLFDILSNILGFCVGNFGLLYYKIPWLIFIENKIVAIYDADLKLVAVIPWFSHLGISTLPYFWIPIVENIIYYLILIGIGLPILKLWTNKKLT